MSTNYSVAFNSNILALDTTVSPNSYVVNRLRDVLFGAVDVLYNPCFQVGTVPTRVPFPGSFTTVQLAWVSNLTTGGDISLRFIPTGGVPQSLLLSAAPTSGQAGGTFLYLNPSTTAGGLADIVLSSTAPTSAEVFVASAASIIIPTIVSISPTSGQVGDVVTIIGTNFGTGANGSVTFNGIAGTPIFWTDTGIVVAVPTGASTGNVVVTVAGNPSNGVLFTVTGPGVGPGPDAPLINTLTPNAGLVGATVVIAGEDFGTTQGSSTVTLNGVPI